MPLSPGQILDNHCRIVSILGHGGFGAVYRVWDTRLERPRAEGILLEAHDLLRARAANIEGDDQRRSLLKNVPTHGELLHLWAAREDH